MERYYKNGQLKFKGNYNEIPNELRDKANSTKITLNNYETKSETKYGLANTWYENGQKKIEANYKDGKMNGKWTWWHENGQIESEGNFKNGKKDGKRTWWFENGQKKAEGNYKNGKEVHATSIGMK